MKKYQSVLAHGSIVVLLWIVGIVIVSFASFGIIGPVSVIAAAVIGGIGGCLWAIKGTRTWEIVIDLAVALRTALSREKRH